MSEKRQLLCRSCKFIRYDESNPHCKEWCALNEANMSMIGIAPIYCKGYEEKRNAQRV